MTLEETTGTEENPTDFHLLLEEDGLFVGPLPPLSNYFGRRPEWKFADKYDP